MKKITTFALIGLSAIALTACSPKSDSNSSSKGSEAKTEQSSAKKDDNVSTEYKNALKKAKSYADTVHLSKEGMKKQLIEFENFTEEEATYAVDNAKIDWKKQALAKAKSYQETLALSTEGLKDQLLNFENFTEEEVNYALENLNK